MRYAQIRKMDISDGPGLRTSLFVQGCAFHCKNCFNSETWDFAGGQEYTNETIKQVLELAKPDYIKGLSVLGGEPMHPVNVEGIIELCRQFKQQYPNKTVWLWSGYTFEAFDEQQKKVLPYLDVLVDGQFIDELRDLKLMYRGSSNQRVIDIPKTLEAGEIISFLK